MALTPYEYQLLCYLIEHADRPVNKRELLQAVSGYSGHTNVNLVRVTVHRLRKKIERNPTHPIYILTVAGGYQFCGSVTF